MVRATVFPFRRSSLIQEASQSRIPCGVLDQRFPSSYWCSPIQSRTQPLGETVALYPSASYLRVFSIACPFVVAVAGRVQYITMYRSNPSASVKGKVHKNPPIRSQPGKAPALRWRFAFVQRINSCLAGIGLGGALPGQGWRTGGAGLGWARAASDNGRLERGTPSSVGRVMPGPGQGGARSCRARVGASIGAGLRSSRSWPCLGVFTHQQSHQIVLSACHCSI